MVATSILAYLVHCVTFIFVFLDLFYLRFHTLDPTQDTHTRTLGGSSKSAVHPLLVFLYLNLGAECQNLQRQGSKTAITLKPKARDLLTPCKKIYFAASGICVASKSVKSTPDQCHWETTFRELIGRNHKQPSKLARTFGHLSCPSAWRGVNRHLQTSQSSFRPCYLQQLSPKIVEEYSYSTEAPVLRSPFHTETSSSTSSSFFFSHSCAPPRQSRRAPSARFHLSQSEIHSAKGRQRRSST